MVTLIIVFAAIFVFACIFIGIINTLRKLDVKIQEAESGIDVALTKRYDMLTKLLAITKGYAKQEKEVLIEVVRLRTGMTIDERRAASNQMTAAKIHLDAVAEAYPELRSSEQFKQLQLYSADAEEHLQAARRAYNSNVSALNQKLVSFPGNMVGSMIGMAQKKFFEADTDQRQDVDMRF